MAQNVTTSPAQNLVMQAILAGGGSVSSKELNDARWVNLRRGIRVSPADVSVAVQELVDLCVIEKGGRGSVHLSDASQAWYEREGII